jgi:hypothetical protein
LSFAGSGSSYLYGFFDQAWKEGMTQDEAEVWVSISKGKLVMLPEMDRKKISHM